MTLIDIQTPDGIADSFQCGESGSPGVLLFMDAIGLRPRIEEIAERIASWGYVVLAPNLFYRHGRAPDLAPTGPLMTPAARQGFLSIALPRLNSLTTQGMLSDIDAYADHLRTVAAPGPFGVTGYCMGARFVLRAAGHRPDEIAAAAGFHAAGLVTGASDSPHLAATRASAEMVFGHADDDPTMPPEAVATLGETLAAAGLRVSNEVYAGAPHGFTMSDTASYDEAATERHFVELRALLERRLPGPRP